MAKHSALTKIKRELKRYLELDLQEYGLKELKSGEYESQYIGVKMKSAFQPIYNRIDGELTGHEAVLNPYLGAEIGSSSDFAFTYAEKAGKLVQFDRASRALHVLNFKKIYGEAGLLFLSVHPNLLISVNEHGKIFERILHAHSVPTRRVVIQIDESLIEQDRLLTAAIDNYRERGYLIGITSFGSRNSHINRLWQYTPNFVKLDPRLIAQAEENIHAKQILPGLTKMIQDVGALSIIPEIENQQQLEIAVESGGALLQGSFLGEAVSAKDLQPSPLFGRTRLRAA
jgi:EAL domain-containing protein (putative c-di-GMP-specific phosphodiesterase class I)